MNGKRIAEMRKLQRLSQEELAEKAKVSRSIISFLETGKEKDVKLYTLIRIANALDCKVEDFL
ncbi:helix-turn-helix domain-containing protein [Streptococcus sp. 10F2]|uniref:helix-turn-helix domain-containing protein n=1 Tax=Streptococcus sp. 121 TaxID=2797637 RepID=UPI0018F0C788|nr:helix-turn-helix transcriptional regulator [Streptococcus sp. 121]MBJ6745419.1 helix-turn-helix transcriptional regulator [Streptococcus sp. 121]